MNARHDAQPPPSGAGAGPTDAAAGGPEGFRSERAKPEWAAALRYRPPDEWTRIVTIDAHAAGEPLRVVVDGFPPPEGATALERRRTARARWDALRTALMWEPRGHADMYGCLLTGSAVEGADLGVLFLHNEGFSTMCGHGIIGVATVLIETGVVVGSEPETTLVIDTPAGLVRATARVEEGRVSEVRFLNVPSFVVELDAEVEVPGLGRVRYDLTFGGAFYAVVDAGSVGALLEPGSAGEIARVGMAIKRAVQATREVEHPVDPDLSFLYGTILVGPPTTSDAHSRNVCVFAEGEVDRSPTGTGVSARLALHAARGEIGRNQTIVVESLLGTRFTGRIVEETVLGPYRAILPEVGGRAWITGRHEFWIDPSDPLGTGFLLR